MVRVILLFLITCLSGLAQAAVRVPDYISDNMVIQRNAEVKVRGWADKGETVIVNLNGQTRKTQAGKDGVWQVSLPAVPVGGPYEMTIKGKSNSIVVKNILSGDVWVCSGQSNMEMSLNGSRGKVNNCEEEVAAANFPKIRLLTVEKNKSNVPLTDAKTSGWKECKPENINDFSATAYFFGREVHQQTNIPVGLINTSWGGTNVETWTSLPTMKSQSQYKSKAAEMESPDFAKKLLPVAQIVDPGIEGEWYKSGKRFKNPEKIQVPSSYNVQGIFWYRKEIVLTAEQAKSPITLSLGRLDDNDVTYLNGNKIGETNGVNVPREYKVDKGLKAGVNELVVCVINPNGMGGFISEADQIFCSASNGKISLAGEWEYCMSMKLEREAGPNDYPSLLYNGMLSPFTFYPVKGAIWYQGEANTGAGYRYRTLFANMINDWRKAWNQPDLPFYFVQLANYKQPVTQPVESDWAELRESQHVTLNLPNTGEAVIIDIGEANDIHPKNKQDVGYRLALNALAKNYGKNVEYSGPEYSSMKIEGNHIVLTFDHTGNGLIAKGKYGYLQGFAVAGADKKFEWAQAYIDGNTVVVQSNKVKMPVAVRYAWADNPDDANLYNSAGLPASPFRTDSWEVSTQSK